jgi:2-polyprenyl-6-hydroxyphenyl methylase/3-demethylubiquinone-9 3-methyltransferase
MKTQSEEVRDGDRFAFGANWARFLAVLDDQRIGQAETSLKTMLDVRRLDGKTFLDAGSGSGLLSLAARRLGARVHSFDYDPQSVACTSELKQRYFPDDREWRIEEGSVLDQGYLESLGTFDIVYCWGVLHHTGAMWVAIENVVSRVRPGGQLCIAIYNDQGWKSHLWWFVKFWYNRLPRPLKPLYAYSLGLTAYLLNILKYTLKLKPMIAIRPLFQYKKNRGMSLVHDLMDWIGGFPYEFASYNVLQSYMSARGLELVRGKRGSSLGSHEMVFRLKPASP